MRGDGILPPGALRLEQGDPVTSNPVSHAAIASTLLLATALLSAVVINFLRLLMKDRMIAYSK